MPRSRLRQALPLRYYLYISDSKLEMLFEQIGQNVLKRISAEVKVDLKVASLTLRGADDPGPTRAARLRIVERFIDAHHQVGTIEEPGGEYFRGRLDMRWGYTRPGAVCFQGTDAKGIQSVLLVGSINHVVGERPRSMDIAASQLPGIMRALEVLSRNQRVLEVLSENQRTPHKLREGYLRMAWRRIAVSESPFAGFPNQTLDFLAVPLAEDCSPERGHIVLGTPLYVAMAQT